MSVKRHHIRIVSNLQEDRIPEGEDNLPEIAQKKKRSRVNLKVFLREIKRVNMNQKKTMNLSFLGSSLS